MSAATARAAGIELGATPRAMLLPPELAAEAKARAQRRLLLFAVLAVLVLVVGAYAAMTYLSTTEQSRLADAQAETTSLLAEQTQYAEIQTVQSKIATVEASRSAVTATEIDWRSYLESIDETLPQDAQITSIGVTSATPLTPLALPSSPLEGARIAEIVLTATTKDVPDIVAWINALSTLQGFTDATPTNVTSAEGGDYQATFLIHIDEGALANRFVAEAPTEEVD